jgi:hypothetical protein
MKILINSFLIKQPSQMSWLFLYPTTLKFITERETTIIRNKKAFPEHRIYKSPERKTTVDRLHPVPKQKMAESTCEIIAVIIFNAR